jgi:hypothetical protein
MAGVVSMTPVIVPVLYRYLGGFTCWARVKRLTCAEDPAEVGVARKTAA